MNGDVLTDLDYSEFLDEHRASDAAASIAAHRREVQVSLGVLEFGDPMDDARLTGYIEKPTYDYEVSMGVYAFAPRALRADRGERASRLPRPGPAPAGGRRGRQGAPERGLLARHRPPRRL